MDNERFDSVSRVLAKNATRRGALGAIGTLAGLVGVGAGEAKSSRKRKRVQVSADAVAAAQDGSCAQLCGLLFLFDRNAQAVCKQNCGCFRSCLGITDRRRRDSCILSAVLQPGSCAVKISPAE
ncbi:MAG: hypothetical protein U0031_00185 [Thermomicrobiales bacterium]